MGKKAGMKKAGAMKVMKAKKVSVIARGRGARARVLSGKKQKTGAGLTKDKLMRKKAGLKNGLKAWADAVKKARKELGLTGFVAIGGKSAAGKALYAKAKSLL